MQVVVVGAGIVGLTTAWQLVKRGHAVTLLEQAEALPNRLAASGDHHRLIRRAYYGADGYARLVDAAYAAWEELWGDLEVRHQVETGILATCQWPGDAADAVRAGLDRTGSPYRQLSPREAAERHPFLDADALAYAIETADGGVLFSRRIAEDLTAWLVRNGVDVRLKTRVTALDPALGVATAATGETFAGDRLVVAAGAWVASLLPGVAADLTAYRTIVAYLDPPDDLRAAWEHAPAVLSTGGDIDGYAVPPVAGTHLKVGARFTKRPTQDASSDRSTDLQEGLVLLRAFAPPLARIDQYKIREVVSCVYVFTADECFYSLSSGRTLVISACSGHGYKFGAAVGSRVAAALESGDHAGLDRWLRAEAVP